MKKVLGLILLLFVYANIISAQGIPCPGTPTVDYAGKTYQTVQIGSQCWLKENLNVGKMINSQQNADNNGTIEKYCYDNNLKNCKTYGGLYQWREAMQYTTTEGTQGICPSGWHIPTLDEFKNLRTSVEWDGNALKEIGQGKEDGAGTDTSGFSALLSGELGSTGYFFDIGEIAYFWCSTEVNTHLSHYMHLNYDHSDISIRYLDNETGFSVRCVKD